MTDGEQGEHDYAVLPEGTPSWKGNHDLGHTGAFETPDGGLAGVVGTKMMKWLLRGDVSEKAWFMGKGAYASGFKNVTYKSIEKIKVMPIR